MFVRVVALPADAFEKIEKTLSNDALKKEGMIVEKRENLALGGGGTAVVAVAHQETPTERVRKWLMIAPIGDITALVSLEMSAKPPQPYADAVIRTMFASLVKRETVPDTEQLAMVPFILGETAGLRLVRVVPGTAAQFTDGPKDTFDATEQLHLVIAASPGGPAEPRDRGQFARDAMGTLPAFKEVRITDSEPMRIGGQAGYEVRATAKDAQNGAEIEMVQWLRFGTGAYLRILGFAPKDKWTDAFTRFRTVRDGLEPR